MIAPKDYAAVTRHTGQACRSAPTGILLGYKLFATPDTGVFSHRKSPSPLNPRSGKALHTHSRSYAPDTVSARNLPPLLTNLPPTIILRKSAAYKPESGRRTKARQPDSTLCSLFNLICLTSIWCGQHRRSALPT